MGIPGFFKWLINKDSNSEDIVKDCIESEITPVDETQRNPNGIEYDNLYLDMNGIIHSLVNENYGSKLMTETAVIQSIFDSINRIFSIVRPRNLLYIAIDGVAPRAKLNEQRSKRAYKLRMPDEIEKKRVEVLANDKKFLPNTSNEKQTNEPFDENCITCGTAFMLRLSKCLQYYICQRMNSKLAWQSIKVILSDANVPGEGEHKIINFIRQQRKLPNYNREIHHVLFSGDADVILLGVSLHEQHVTIMREKQKPSFCLLCHQYEHSFETCQGLSRESFNQSNGIKITPIKTTYIFVHLSKLCDKLYEIQTSNQQNFNWDRQRFLDDWVFICLMIGNDFLPDIPLFEMHENSIDNLLEIYSNYVSVDKKYLTDNGKLNIKTFKRISREFRKIEDRKSHEQPEIIKQLLNNSQTSTTQTIPSFNKDEIIAQKQKPMISFRPPPFSRATNSSANKSSDVVASSVSSNAQKADSIISKLSDSSNLNRSGENQTLGNNPGLLEGDWRECYYQSKFSISEPRQTIVQNYFRGLQWVLQYYYHGVPSWDWYYPYHYAPLASDLTNVNDDDESAQFNKESQPLKPLEQLICILPVQCAKYLPEKWESLYYKKDFPIIDLHPSNFRIDPNGKRYQSQYTVILPFVDEICLEKILNYQYPSLTSEEEKRNEIHDDLLFIHKRDPNSRLLETFCSESKNISEHSNNIPPAIGIYGYVWRDDETISISQTIDAPSNNYSNISKNYVLCVKYR